MKKKPIKTLKYMKNFKCIGSECEDHCCSGWQIKLDKNDYEHIQKHYSHTEKDREQFRKGVLRKSEGTAPNSFATFSLKEDGNCFFEKSGLCTMHQQFGENALARVCATYPRRFTQTEEEFELTGSLSCPEIARLALLSDDAMEWESFGNGQLPERINLISESRSHTPFYGSYSKPIREIIVWLMKAIGFSVEEKIYFTLYFSQKVSPFYHRDISKDPGPRFEKIINRMNDLSFITKILQSYKSSTPSNVTTFRFISLILNARREHKFLSRYNNLCSNILNSYSGIGVPFPNKNSSVSENLAFLEAIWPVYQKRKVKALQYFSSRISRYFTNFCLNYWFQEKYTNSADLFCHTRQLILYFAVVKFLFFSSPDLLKITESHSMNQYEKLTALDKIIVDVVQIFMKSFSHNSAMIKYIQEAMTALNLSQLNDLLPLLKV